MTAAPKPPLLPWRTSKPRPVFTPFGWAMCPGPFADDYTKLLWIIKDHRDGETATFRVAGLEAYVADCDGDSSWWQIKDIRTRQVICEGEDWGYEPHHFFRCLAEAEAALRAEVERRKQNLRRAA